MLSEREDSLEENIKIWRWPCACSLEGHNIRGTGMVEVRAESSLLQSTSPTRDRNEFFQENTSLPPAWSSLL